MKIQNDKYYFNFHAGLTKQIKAEILSCNPIKISKEFSKNGISTDFKDNKTISWSSLKCLQLFKALKLPLPNGIFVEDFKNLNVKPSLGFTNVAPTRLYKDSELITDEKTIFFNEQVDKNYSHGNSFWESIDEYSDESYNAGHYPTDFFLYSFLHEFSHAAHEGNLINVIGANKTLKFFMQILDLNIRKNFRLKNKDLFSKLCDYALDSQAEAVACDLGNRISVNLDNSLNVPQNLLNNSPYDKLTMREKVIGIKKEHTTEDVLRRSWFGKLV